MIFETETKITLLNDTQLNWVLTECRKRANSIGKHVFQRDEYYDTTDELLRQKDLTVRLRRVNSHILLALKGPRIFLPKKLYKRIELEFTVCDESEIREQFKYQELITTAIIEKRRYCFYLYDCSIAIDELPFIKAFIEIESDTYENIKEVLQHLSLSEDNAVNKNYTELLELKLSGLGLPIRPNLRATFEAEKQWIALHCENSKS